MNDRRSNRERMPVVAAMIDDLRAALGPELSKGMKLIYAKEGDQQIGVPDTREGVVPNLPEKLILEAEKKLRSRAP